MMKRALALAVAVLALTLLSACTKPEAPASPEPAASQTPPATPAASAPAAAPAANDVVYVCEMGCELLDKPGECPKCGMKLLEVQRGDIAYVCGVCGHESAQPGACPKDQTVLVFKIKQKPA